MNTRHLLVVVVMGCLVALVTAVLGLACTEFRVQAEDGTVVIGRSMEFRIDLHWTLKVQRRGATHHAETPDGGVGLSWENAYGYLYVDSMDLNHACDGMNEVGLCVSTLALCESVYQDVRPAPDPRRSISHADLPAYLLGTCKTVDDVRMALEHVYVWGEGLLGLPPFGVHYGVYDATGAGIVVEYINGDCNVYENTLGVMTNSPPYDWQMTNVERYLFLDPFNPRPMTLGDVHRIDRSGFGAGLLGLPGDPTPTSRFVRVFAMLHFAHPPANQSDAVILAEHILNVVDIPIGVARDYLESEVVYERPYWVLIKDLTHRILYVRNYGDLGFYRVDLQRLDFGGIVYDPVPIGDLPVQSVDYTDRFAPKEE